MVSETEIYEQARGLQELLAASAAIRDRLRTESSDRGALLLESRRLQDVIEESGARFHDCVERFHQDSLASSREVLADLRRRDDLRLIERLERCEREIEQLKNRIG